jgi:hypothetical protein
MLPGKVVISELIDLKIKEFNELYSLVNNQIGAVTQKVPKSEISEHKSETFLREQGPNHHVIIIQDKGQ